MISGEFFEKTNFRNFLDYPLDYDFGFSFNRFFIQLLKIKSAVKVCEIFLFLYDWETFISDARI